MAGVTLMESRPEDSCTPFDVAAMVGLAGDLCGVLTIRCSRSSAMKVASCMLGVSEPLSSSHASDAVGEICNMVAGCFKAKIDGLEERCMLSVPTVIHGASFVVHSLAASDNIELSRSFPGALFSFKLQVRL